MKKMNIKDYSRLIKYVRNKRLCSIKFKNKSIILKQQINNKGAKVMIKYTYNKHIKKIDFIDGDYKDSSTLQDQFSGLFEFIHLVEG